MNTITTFSFYYGIFILATLLAYGDKKIHIRFGISTFTLNTFQISGILLLIVSGIRYNVGTDYDSYVKMYDWINLHHNFYFKSIFVHYLSRLLYICGLSAQWLFIIFGGLTIFFVYTAIRYTLKDKAYLGVLFFLLSGFYFYSFNGVRVCLATSIILFSIKYIEQKDLLRFVMLTLFAASIHNLAILFIPFYFARNRFTLYVYLLVGITLLFNIDRVIIEFIRVLGANQSSYYYKAYINSAYLQVSSWSLPIGVIITMIIGIFNLVVFSNMSEADRKKYASYYIVYFIGVIFILLSKRLLLFNRLSDYFYYSIIIVLPISISRMRQKYIVAFLLIAYLSISMFDQVSDERRMLSPYKTVLFKSYKD